MNYRPEMRASDDDRERIADRLREAHGDGRLTAEEFDSRIDALFSAQTYGELEPLVRDLPARPMPTAEPAPVHAPSTAPQPKKAGNGLRTVWMVWTIVVSVNVVIWVLTSISNASLEYFWPIWVAGPWGTILLVITLFHRLGRSK